jgi:hypothetical protein
VKPHPSVVLLLQQVADRHDLRPTSLPGGMQGVAAAARRRPGVNPICGYGLSPRCDNLPQRDDVRVVSWRIRVGVEDCDQLAAADIVAVP